MGRRKWDKGNNIAFRGISMIEEMKVVIAFIFEKLGKREVSPSEFYLCLSMDMRWCSVAQAKQFMSRALEYGLLKKKNSNIEPAFSIDDVSIPFGFKPSVELFGDSREDENLLSKVSKLSDVPEEKLLGEIESIEKEKNVLRDVAILLYAHKRGIDISKYINDVFISIKSEA